MVYIICILPYEYYMGMIYILWLCIWIFEFILVGGGVGGCIRSLALGSDALILPLVRILCIPLRFGLGNVVMVGGYDYGLFPWIWF